MLSTPWWQSGVELDEPERQIYVAAIWAKDKAEIKEILYGCYDERPEPDDIEISFINERSDDWDPTENASGRFPWADWMTTYWERMEYIQEG